MANLPVYGTQSISRNGTHSARSSSTGAWIQYRRVVAIRCRKPRHPWDETAATQGSRITGNTTHRTSQVTTLKIRKTEFGRIGLRNLSVSQEEMLKAGWVL